MKLVSSSTAEKSSVAYLRLTLDSKLIANAKQLKQMKEVFSAHGKHPGRRSHRSSLRFVLTVHHASR